MHSLTRWPLINFSGFNCNIMGADQSFDCNQEPICLRFSYVLESKNSTPMKLNELALLIRMSLLDLYTANE